MKKLWLAFLFVISSTLFANETLKGLYVTELTITETGVVRVVMVDAWGVTQLSTIISNSLSQTTKILIVNSLEIKGALKSVPGKGYVDVTLNDAHEIISVTL